MGARAAWHRYAAAGLTVLAVAACAELATPPGPGPSRAAGFRASAVRLPAVFLRVSVDRGGGRLSSFTDRERAAIPAQYENATQEALDALGVLPVDVTLEARPFFEGSERPLEGLDVQPALGRARATGATYLLVLDARLSRRDLVHCRESRRPLSGTTTYWEAGLEIIRVGDGVRLLTEPPGEAQRVVDVELDCENARLVRRLGMDEMIQESVRKVLRTLAEPPEPGRTPPPPPAVQPQGMR